MTIKAGPTGKYNSGGPRLPGDKGGVVAVIQVWSLELRQLSMDFGALVTWVATTPEQAATQANAMRLKVYEVFGELDYDPSTLPIKVTVVNGLIRSDFPWELSVLIANPEVYLAWAQRLDEAVTKCNEGNIHG